MKKLLRTLIVFTVLFFFLATIALIAITQFVNPNQFKTDIQNLVGKKTGRELSIGGNIHWTFYPWLGLEMNDLTLQNLPSFAKTPFATLSTIGFKVNLIPLFRGQIHISSIYVSGLELYLTINKQGQSNWADLSSKQAKTLPNYTQSVTDPHIPTSPINVHAEQLRLDNITLNFDNQPSNTRILIQNVLFSARQIQPNTPFPIKGKMQLSVFPSQIQDLINFKGQLLFDFDKTTVSLKDFSIEQTITRPQQAALSSKIQLTSDFNWRQGWATIEPLQGSIGETPITGNLHFTNLYTIPLVQGHFSAKNLLLGSLKMTDLDATIKGQSGVLSFNPVVATLYKGTFKNETTLNLKQDTYHTKGQFSGIQIADLISGEAQGTYSFNTRGESFADWSKYLQGQLSFQITNGTFKGLDLDYMFAEAKALLKGRQNQTPNTGHTAIGKLTGTIQAQNGFLYNQDLKLSSPKFFVTGKGTYGLPPQNYLDYAVETTLNATEDPEKTALFKNLPLRIYITGHPPQLNYKPDFEQLFKAILLTQAKKQSDKILNKLHQELGSDLGEGVQDALQRGLGETLKNLPFKDILKNNQ